MKKLLTTLTALALILSFAACGKKDIPSATTVDTSVSATDTTADTAAKSEETEETAISPDTGAAATEDTATSAPETSATEETPKVTEATTAEVPVTSETTTIPNETTETTAPTETEATAGATTEETTAPTVTEATTEATEETTAPETPDADTNAALEVLNKTWAAYPEDDKFASCGGDLENAVIDGPGSMSLDAATMDRMLGFPQDSVEKVDACASLIHMLNANTFTCGAYRVKDGEDTATLAEAIRANIQARRWMCGYPETLRILTIGDTMVSMFGNGKLIDAFVEAAKSVYPDLSVAVNEPIQ